MTTPDDNGTEIYRYFSITRRALLSVRSNGVTLASTVFGEWRVHARKRADAPLERWLEGKRNLYMGLKPWQQGVEDLPTTDQLEEWVMDSVCESITGDTVEPDGYGPDGAPSWLIALGLV